MAAVAAAIDHQLNQRKRGISGQMRDPAPGRTSSATRVVMLGGERYRR